jgi:Cu(I)/Ag(I) efflux system membrane fusion protein
MVARFRPAAVAAAFALIAGAACTARAGTQPAGQQLTPAIVDPAVAIQKALAKDSMAGVHGNAETIATEAATRLTPHSPEIAKTAKALQAAPDLAAARKAFGDMSTAIVGYMETHKLTLDPRIHVAYCPMADKPWLQAGTVIANPYYGTEMPNCGSIKQ